MEEYKDLVYYIANKYRGYGNFEDLVQAGFIGLYEALKRYDDRLNAKFSTFAYSYILGEISKCANSFRPFKVSNDITSLTKKIEEARNFLALEYKRYPTDDEISKYLGISLYDIYLSSSSISPVASLDYLYDDNSMHEYVGTNYNIDDMMILKDELKSISDMDRKIFLSYYLYDYTESEIATSLGINQVAVSRHKKKTLNQIKAKIGV